MRGADLIRRRTVSLALAGLLALSLTACQRIPEQYSQSGSIPDTTQTAVTDTVWVTFTWTAPTTGSPVVYYRVETSEGWMYEATHLNRWGDGKMRVPFLNGKEGRIRVAGVDAEGHQGPWSDWSEDRRAPDRPDIHNPIDREEPQ